MLINYAAVNKEQIPTILDEIVNLYSSVYSEPPYSEGPEQIKRFRQVFPKEAVRSGFSMIIATSEDRMVGAAYGWTMPPAKWFSSANSPPEEILQAEKFAVMEWIVRRAYRKHGVGSQLMRRLTERRHEQWAMLASDPRSDARAIYARSGWVQVGKSQLSWGTAMDVLVLPLNDEARTVIANELGS